MTAWIRVVTGDSLDPSGVADLSLKSKNYKKKTKTGRKQIIN